MRIRIGMYIDRDKDWDRDWNRGRDGRCVLGLGWGW